MAKGQKVVDQILGEKHEGGGKISLIKMDLSSFASVRSGATLFWEKSKQLNLLINNAGIMARWLRIPIRHQPPRPLPPIPTAQTHLTRICIPVVSQPHRQRILARAFLRATQSLRHHLLKNTPRPLDRIRVLQNRKHLVLQSPTPPVLPLSSPQHIRASRRHSREFQSRSARLRGNDEGHVRRSCVAHV
jgi:hypothetical protein